MTKEQLHCFHLVNPSQVLFHKKLGGKGKNYPPYFPFLSAAYICQPKLEE